MSLKISCLLPLFFIGINCYKQNTLEPIVTIRDGKLRGVVGKNYDGENIYKFLGVPYAKPPVNDLRFKDPQHPDPWQGTKDATKPGETCYSRSDISPEIVGSEDCLYLNVYIRNLPKPNSPLKPVMVWMYGGGLTLGTSRPGVYGPEFLLTKDIILVSFNYRLGVLGFLSISDPKLGVPGNLGLKDQNFALKWVRNNIKSFGGNPDDVTIFGNSAGSSSVHAHILSPASRGLFHKAVLQSGTALNSWFWGSKDNVVEIAEKAGRNVSGQREALEVLKKLKVEELFAAQEKVKDSPYPSDRRPFSAVQEYPNPSGFLTESPVEIIKKSSYNHVPIMMGYTMNEGMLLDFDVDFAKKNGIEYPPFVFQRLVPIDLNVSIDTPDNLRILNVLKRLYEDKVDSKGLERYDPMTDSYMLVGIVETIRQHLENLRRPIYVYRMSLAGELNFLKRLLNRTQEPGVCHGDELGYLFDSEVRVQIQPGSIEDKSIRNFVNLWTNFAIHGNPVENMPGVTWKPVENSGNIKVLDIGEELKFLEMPEKDRMDVWQREILNRWPLVRFYSELTPVAVKMAQVGTKSGLLKGIIGKNLDGQEFFKFLGVPYAEPPVGPLRFQPPVPIKPWKGIREATDPGNQSIAMDDSTYEITGSEDCLYLNIYTKELPSKSSKPKPVLFYIHGGGFIWGCGKSTVYGPEHLMIKDIVLVVINYRLGALGFLSSDGIYGNMGLKDTLEALRWVNDNIAAFNGDPNNITLVGNSAGAVTVQSHILSKASRGLFHKAVLQSGSILNPWAMGLKNVAREMVKHMGKNVETEREAVEILMKLSGVEIFRLQEKLVDSFYAYLPRPFAVVIEEPNDSAFITEHPRKTMAQGDYARVPMMMGYTDKEGWFMDLTPKYNCFMPPYDIENVIPVDLEAPKGSEKSQKISKELLKLYGGTGEEARYDQLSDSVFLAGITENLRYFLKFAKDPIYFYRISVSTQLNALKAILNRWHLPGACHADEKGYLFKTAATPPIHPGSDEDKYLRLFVELWTNFVTYGDPTPETRFGFKWTPVQNEDELKLLDIGQEIVMKRSPETERIEGWKRIYREYLPRE
ncbi:uncharacterized protein LOC126733761 [Anthonomus grandis grandis]|uniref:uncharacterized protein LOC126733761 n=1 Tax=Anthonomus grandis grandis TaxID=2921223 RepID=UPI0021666E66|nr:uncharacterized protein LOC126733761 [Anthonomus grandis grandis]